MVSNTMAANTIEGDWAWRFVESFQFNLEFTEYPPPYGPDLYKAHKAYKSITNHTTSSFKRLELSDKTDHRTDISLELISAWSRNFKNGYKCRFYCNKAPYCWALCRWDGLYIGLSHLDPACVVFSRSQRLIISADILKSWRGGMGGGQKIIWRGAFTPFPPPRWRRQCVADSLYCIFYCNTLNTFQLYIYCLLSSL